MLCANMRKLRELNRMTLEEVAERLDISRQALSKWEKGESVPDVLKCDALAQIYGVNLDLMLHGDLARALEADGDDGRYIFGVMKVGERGQVTLPKKAREIFQIEPGDGLLALGDVRKGLAMVKVDGLKQILGWGK